MNRNKEGVIFIDGNMLIKNGLPVNFLLKSEKNKDINKKLHFLHLLAVNSEIELADLWNSLVDQERRIFGTNDIANSLESIKLKDSYSQNRSREMFITQCDKLSNRLIEKTGSEYRDEKRDLLFGCYQKSCNLDNIVSFANNNGFDIVIIIEDYSIIIEDYSIIMKEIYEKLFPEVNKIIIVSGSKMNDSDLYISLQMDDLECASFTLVDNNSDNLEAALVAGWDTKELKKDCEDFENQLMFAVSEIIGNRNTQEDSNQTVCGSKRGN